MSFDLEIKKSVEYLGSDRALKTLEPDVYWPKWDSPWWHMLLLHEMGETKKIPKQTIIKYVAGLNKIPLKIFPIKPEDTPEGVDPFRGSPCHCQLGNVYQVLSAWGLDVDQEIPWMRDWFLKYQMDDGGFNCDGNAYLIKEECPSSMVGTISAFEAVLLYTPRPLTSDEKIFLDKAAQFLIKRKIMLGSETKHNAEEREEALAWLKPCFPRFYLYDVLRGLNALLLWSEKTKEPLPESAIGDVVKYIQERFSDGKIKNERQSFEGVGTLLQTPSGEWLGRQPATLFPLLQKVSVVGEVSPYLTRQWSDARQRISNDKKLRDMLK